MQALKQYVDKRRKVVCLLLENRLVPSHSVDPHAPPHCALYFVEPSQLELLLENQATKGIAQEAKSLLPQFKSPPKLIGIVAPLPPAERQTQEVPSGQYGV